MAKNAARPSFSEQNPGWFGELREKAWGHFGRVKRAAGFHTLIFLPSAALMLVLNLILSGNLVWLYLVVAAWGIGYFSHLRFCASLWRDQVRLSCIKTITQEHYALLRELIEIKNGYGWHSSLFLLVTAFFAGLNVAVSPQVLWFVIVSAGWGIGFCTHTVWYFVRRRFLKNLLKEYGIHWKLSGMIRTGKKTRTGFGRFYEEACSLRKNIQNRMVNSPCLRAAWGGKIGLLDYYTSLLREFVEKEKTIAHLQSRIAERVVSYEIAMLDAREWRERKRSSLRAGLPQEHHRSVLELEERRLIIENRLQTSLEILKKASREPVARNHNHNGSNGSHSPVRELEEQAKELEYHRKSLKKTLRHLQSVFS